MAHHKRKRSKNQRAGCLLCKPWKMNGLAQNKPDAESFSDHRRRREANSELKQFLREPLRLIAYFNLPSRQRKRSKLRINSTPPRSYGAAWNLSASVAVSFIRTCRPTFKYNSTYSISRWPDPREVVSVSSLNLESRSSLPTSIISTFREFAKRTISPFFLCSMHFAHCARPPSMDTAFVLMRTQ
ncbi:MAG: hypothetical protein E6J74_36575 [Deltaproteobacteria bacterium]|nr:MAG: hypothetical protein E6J74_36575 [Deltaproteobacteria bacterium]